MKNERGVTLAELMVAMFVLSLASVTLFLIYKMGASAWMKGNVKTELLQSCQVLAGRVSREVERSIYDSVSLGPGGNGAALLSAQDANGVFQYDPFTERPLWQKYVVFYYDSTAKTVSLREVVGVAGTAQETAPAPIETFSGGAITDYYNGGRVLSREVQSCVFSITPAQQLALNITTEKSRYGSPVPEKVSLRSVATFRN